MSTHSAFENAARFLAISPQFQLGELPTESRHPLTRDLSRLANENLPEAIAVLKKVELLALESISPRAQGIENLAHVMLETRNSGGRIFFCGCGATGRLSLSLEVLWREVHRESSDADQVISFIAGGDYALVRSIENFEDHPEYGARQLRDLGFREGDLLISTTEGGETPFVIGATEEATKISSRKPWFLFCNPAETLMRVERSRRVIDNPSIEKISFHTGPMAIAGSTRLQASTVLMLSAGAALFNAKSPLQLIEEFKTSLMEADLVQLTALIELESSIYRNGLRCTHATNDYAITVITDTTERSPTFSLAPFENSHDKNSLPSWTYLSVPSTKTANEAWYRILGRAPRPIDWPGFVHRFGPEILEGFDFSHQALGRRTASFGQQHVIEIRRNKTEIEIVCESQAARLNRPNHLLLEHLILKVAMNISSTLVMGRLGRFESNLMLYVKASNNKLIDRSIRFIRALISDKGRQAPSYEETCHALFEAVETLAPEEPAVLKTVELLIRRS